MLHFAFLHGDTAHFHGISYSKPGRPRRDNGTSIAKAIEYYASIRHSLQMKIFRLAKILFRLAVSARV